jgi:hypothetical protein
MAKKLVDELIFSEKGNEWFDQVPGLANAFASSLFVARPQSLSTNAVRGSSLLA